MHWLRAYYAFPFKVLAFFVRIYMTNRAWLEARLSRKHAADALKGLVVLTFVIWILVFLFAREEYGNNLNNTIKSFWSDKQK